MNKEEMKDTVTIPRDLWENVRRLMEIYDRQYAESIREEGSTMNPEAVAPRKPTLDDYTTIKTYEDACEALGEKEVVGDSDSLPAHIVALMKLETISRALWGMEWRPKMKKGGNFLYIPVFYLDGRITSISISPSGYLTPTGINLYQETPEKAEYFGWQFIDLWAEYLGFEVKEEGGER